MLAVSYIIWGKRQFRAQPGERPCKRKTLKMLDSEIFNDKQVGFNNLPTLHMHHSAWNTETFEKRIHSFIQQIFLKSFKKQNRLVCSFPRATVTSYLKLGDLK